jgi:hypothetical protein
MPAQYFSLAAWAAALAVVLVPPVGAQTPKFVLEVELGPAWQNYNDVEIPNDGTATRFSLYDLVGAGPVATGRLYLTWNMAERRGLRLLAAPFSYRLSYRYGLRSQERTAAWIGFTAKVRDAVIAVDQGDRTDRKDDLGFVPLLHLAGEWGSGSRRRR